MRRIEAQQEKFYICTAWWAFPEYILSVDDNLILPQELPFQVSPSIQNNYTKWLGKRIGTLIRFCNVYYPHVVIYPESWLNNENQRAIFSLKALKNQLNLSRKGSKSLILAREYDEINRQLQNQLVSYIESMIKGINMIG